MKPSVVAILKTGGYALLSLSCLSTVAAAQSVQKSGETAVPAIDETLSATFFADSSCLLRIDERNEIGRTVIDAKVDTQGSRMMIHCDTSNGQRLTLMANGNSLGSRERVALLTAAEMDSGEDGIVAWLTRTDADISEADAPQRFLSGGQVMIRETPVANVAGSALQSGQQYFASVQGVLEPMLINLNVDNGSEVVETGDDETGQTETGTPSDSIQPTASDDSSS